MRLCMPLSADSDPPISYARYPHSGTGYPLQVQHAINHLPCTENETRTSEAQKAATLLK